MSQHNTLTRALQEIADWNSHTTEFAVDYGSNGVRDFYRGIARAALSATQPAQAAPRLIGWRTDDYLMETSDRAKAENWEVHHQILPIFEGDPHTKLQDPDAIQAQDKMADAPIPMVLYCPGCGMQHIDRPEGQFYPGMTAEESTHTNKVYGYWGNPPHRSHLCHGCGTIWRPADLATVGVESVETKGKSDTWRGLQTAAPAQAAQSDWGAQQFKAPVYPPDGTESPFTVINLGSGKVQMGDSIHDGRLPALWFGVNGQGMGHEEIMNRQARPGETLAVVTFANVEGLDVLLEVIQRIRRDKFPEAQAAQGEPTLRDYAADLVDAGHDFWKACEREAGGGAVRWLSCDDGTLIVFTRVEYRDEIMAHVMGYKAPVVVFDEDGMTALEAEAAQGEPLCDDEGCDHHGTPHVCVNNKQPAQGAGEVVAWCTPDGERCVTARTYEGARKDGGAMWSSMVPFTVPAYTQPATGAVVPDMVEIMALADSYRNATCHEATASAREWLRAAIAASGRQS